MEPHPEDQEGIGSRPHGEEEMGFCKIKDSTTVHGGKGGKQAQREISGQMQGWKHMDGFCFLNVRRSCERGGGAGDLGGKEGMK